MGVDEEEADEGNETPFDAVHPSGFCNIHHLVTPSIANMDMQLTIPALCLGAAVDTGS